jgi:hypothetical protein
MPETMRELAQRHREAVRTVQPVRADTRAEGPSLLGAAVAEVLASPAKPALSLRERLVRRLGWGDDRVKRSKLYDKLCRLHAQHEEQVERLISEAWSQSVSASRHRDRYFCRAILAKVREAGLCLVGEEVACETF